MKGGGLTNFAREIVAAAADSPERPAVRLDDATLSYRALDDAVAHAAGLLESRGVAVGDRVGMQLPNVPYFPIVYDAVLRLGAVAVPMNPLLTGREVAYHLSDAGSRLMVGWHDFDEPARAGTAAAGAECILVRPGEFEELLGGSTPVHEVEDRQDDDPAVVITHPARPGRRRAPR